MLRTDAKVPARALAILDHDLVLLLSPGLKKIKSLEDLKKQKPRSPQYPRRGRRLSLFREYSLPKLLLSSH